MSDRPTLPPGQLPNIFDTNPPAMHPATVVADGRVYIDEAKLHPQRQAHGPLGEKPAPTAHAGETRRNPAKPATEA